MYEKADETTTAKDLEEKFDWGDDVLDSFGVRKARVIKPQSDGSPAKGNFAYPVKGNAKRPAVVREKSARLSH